MSCILSEKEVKVVMESPATRSLIVQIGEVKGNFFPNTHKLVTEKENTLIKKIESLVFNMIYCTDELPPTKYSDYISKNLGVNYTYLSKLFSKVKSITIEHYIIAHKIERVKQLMLDKDLTLSEIAWKLHYSSTAHLAAQFKKVTGQTSSFFRKLHGK
jgi:AraC-like DNA-binding protein